MNLFRFFTFSFFVAIGFAFNATCMQPVEDTLSVLPLKTLCNKAMIKKYEKIDPTHKFTKHLLIRENGSIRLQAALFFDREIFPKLRKNAQEYFTTYIYVINDMIYSNPELSDHLQLILVDYVLNGIAQTVREFEIEINSGMKNPTPRKDLSTVKDPVSIICESDGSTILPLVLKFYPEKLKKSSWEYENGYTPLHAVVSCQQEKMLNFLASLFDQDWNLVGGWLQCRSKLKYKEGLPLEIVLNQKIFNKIFLASFFRWLKKQRCEFAVNGISDPFGKNKTMLHCAVANQDLISVSLILELKPHLSKNSEGQTARDIAVKNQDTSCIKLIDEYREQDLKDTQEREQRLKEQEETQKQNEQRFQRDRQYLKLKEEQEVRRLQENQNKKSCCTIL